MSARRGSNHDCRPNCRGRGRPGGTGTGARDALCSRRRRGTDNPRTRERLPRCADGIHDAEETLAQILALRQVDFRSTTLFVLILMVDQCADRMNVAKVEEMKSEMEQFTWEAEAKVSTNLTQWELETGAWRDEQMSQETARQDRQQEHIHPRPDITSTRQQQEL